EPSMVARRRGILLLLEELLEVRLLAGRRLQEQGDSGNLERALDRTTIVLRPGSGVNAASENNGAPAIDPGGNPIALAGSRDQGRTEKEQKKAYSAEDNHGVSWPPAPRPCT